MRSLLLIASAIAAALFLVAAAQAGPIIDRAVAALHSDPVYVDPAAELAPSGADQDRLRRKLDGAGAGPVYIAILPNTAEQEAGGSPDGVLQAIHDGLGLKGTYAAVVGTHFRAGSDVLSTGAAGRLATEALDSHRSQGVTATLVDFIDRVAADRAGGGGDGGGGGQPSGGGSVVVGLLIAGVVGFLLWQAVRKRRTAQAELAEVKAAAHDDLIALADDVQKLERPVEANPQARQEYAQALGCYEKASTSYDRATQPRQLEAVASALEEGRWHMSAAQARLDGLAPPERRPPCFFDPRHGPSSRDVDWAPPGGAARKVPACEADAQAVERGVQPASREVMTGGRMVPYWNAPPYFGPWAGGYFMPFGGTGFISGLFVGELLGGAFGGWGYGSWAGSGTPGGFGNWNDGGTGGGDFGGGMSFGGGDFGGGGGGGDF
ncbi:MAG: hypothetical protein QOE13_293 [Gaiellaceae bacterium]|jgi:hypothetical protein|nr:hypothetical protein [Gaiellaceae bacterium]